MRELLSVGLILLTFVLGSVVYRAFEAPANRHGVMIE